MNGNGIPEPWDENTKTNPDLLNSDRFVVYEWDVYSAHTGPIAVHVAMAGGENTYIFKEIKFYKILNGTEVSKQPRNESKAKFTTNTTWGSLVGTRSISYRYYTANGVSEIDDYEANAGVDNVIEDDTDAPVEYYNLQGIRIAEPTHGFYIRRQGNKTTKVIL